MSTAKRLHRLESRRLCRLSSRRLSGTLTFVYNGLIMTRQRILPFIGILLCVSATAPLFCAEIVQTLTDTTFNENIENTDWRAERNCRAVLREDTLRIEALQGLPQIFRRVNFIGGTFRLIMEVRTGTESDISLYWTSRGSFQRSENNKVVVQLDEDGHWHTYEFLFTVPDILESMMLRFSAPDGSWDIRSIKLIRSSRPPMSIQEVMPIVHEGQERIRFTVSNDVIVPMRYRIGNRQDYETLARGETVELAAAVRTEGNLGVAALRLYPQGFPCIVYPVFLYREVGHPAAGHTEWIRKPLGNDMTIEMASDARMARLWRGEELFGIIAPIVHREGVIPKFVLTEDSTDTEWHFASEEVDLRINIEATAQRTEGVNTLTAGGLTQSRPQPLFLHFEIKTLNDNSAPLEGPVVRLFGELRSGLLPGVEFFGPGGTSSSEIDVAQPNQNRSRPNPYWITMPLAVLETDKGAAALYWDDTTLQPAFSAPNRFDHTDDHRFSLLGAHIKATLELCSPASLCFNESSEDNLTADNTTKPDGKKPDEYVHEDIPAAFRAIRTHVARKGFPAPPAPLRTPGEQLRLYADALAGRLQSEVGGQWGQALEPVWERQPFADVISTSVRLTEAAGGRHRNPSLLVPGGSDISNDAVYFLAGRIPEWQRQREAAIRQIITTSNPDGSFLFRTRFPEWETAASSFGYTALKTLTIMEYVRITGDNELFAVVQRALEYLEQCTIPGGGYYWDTPFHTPDLQAAASLVWLYTWAYEYSGNTHYLERAVHFAYAGLPFVYQTASPEREHMLYGTVGKFGGTNRRPPLHFGLSSTRVGIQYAYALNLLAQHDGRADWKTVALGILTAAENLQYTDEERAGCVPELFDVVKQEPSGWTMNPSALASLRWAVEGRVDSLFVLVDGRDRYTAPYPLRKVPEGVEAYGVPPGQRFHILHNANRYGTAEGDGIIHVD